MDQENLIDKILNENEDSNDLDLETNKKNYKLNAIINEQFLDKEESENNNENQKNLNNNEQNKSINEPKKEKEKESEKTSNILSKDDKKKEIEKRNENLKKEKDIKSEKRLKKVEIEKNKQNEIKNKEEKESKIEDFYPPYQNPIDFVQYFEVERTNIKISKEMNNFILQNNIKKDNKYVVSNITTLSKMSNDISKLDINLITVKNNTIILISNAPTSNFQYSNF